MDIETEAEIKVFVEQNRSAVSDEFKAYCTHIEAGLANGNWPVLTLRGDKGDGEVRLANAALHEIHLFLCTDDKKYAEVRKRAGSFVKLAIPTISAYVAGVCGDVSKAAISAGVGLVALTVLRLGTGIFCRVTASKVSIASEKGRKK